MVSPIFQLFYVGMTQFVSWLGTYIVSHSGTGITSRAEKAKNNPALLLCKTYDICRLSYTLNSIKLICSMVGPLFWAPHKGTCLHRHIHRYIRYLRNTPPWYHSQRVNVNTRSRIHTHSIQQVVDWVVPAEESSSISIVTFSICDSITQ